ncbi:DUF2059 domain-containing protein [Opitutus sp. ER46]|uniref:DUF2059 domain-containing protein n=1 Tax=Opitutus sp. ER46 TaxID=2161864 RepID=UPI000D30C15F|nr:DUF2059 domain-containing protein [Opitutus sp. ER46]PTX95579.1 hypothetical protein DB354_09170 [Opitutus sp. ER46]
MITSLRLALTTLLALLATATYAAETTLLPELRGILATGKAHRFALVTPGGDQSRWCSLGDTFAGWKLEEFRAGTDSLVLSQSSQRAIVALRTATTAEGETASATAKATVAEADALLGQMQFDAMWDAIVVEQKKGMVTALRQQTAADFKRAGLRPEEIDTLLGRMGDLLVADLQSDAMRQDFARIYAEVYTKDELAGVAAFHATAAGEAWNRKQPEVQQRLMQVLMPRVMQGMPAAQKLATDYVRERASAK